MVIASVVTGQVSLPAIGTWIHTVTRSVTDYTINANLNNFAFIQVSDRSINALIRHIPSHVFSEDIIFFVFNNLSLTSRESKNKL